MDPVQNVVGYADPAVVLFGGRQMKHNLDEVIAITPSGVEALAVADKKRIEIFKDIFSIRYLNYLHI